MKVLLFLLLADVANALTLSTSNAASSHNKKYRRALKEVKDNAAYLNSIMLAEQRSLVEIDQLIDELKSEGEKSEVHTCGV